MLISRLYGGMGNQMFQYAFGRVLAEKLNSELILDIRFLSDNTTRSNFTLRKFDLDLFNINAKIGDWDNLSQIPYHFSKAQKAFQLLKCKFGIKTYINGFRLIKEEFYNESELKKGLAYILDGYWQKHSYFEKIETLIKSELTFKDQPTDKIKEIEDYIKDRNSIAIQIRKTDYLTIAKNRQLFVDLTPDYFEISLNYLKKNLNNPIILIFSDDNDWVKKHFTFIKDEMIIIEDEWKGPKYQYSMYLMNKCKNHIISNSSFGWWGAFLSNYPEQRVVAPKNWYKIASKNKNISVPKSWIKL